MRYRATIAAIALVVGVAACALAQSSRPTEPKQDEAAAKRQQEANDQLRAIASGITAIREKQAETEQRVATYESDQRRGVFGPPLWPDISLVAVGVAAAFIAVLTLSAIRKQVEANHLEAVAAKASADGLKSAERAYVAIRNQQADETWEKGDRGFYQTKRAEDDGRVQFKLEVRIENTGQTPAHIHGGMIRPFIDLTIPFEPPVFQTLRNDTGYIPGNFLHANGRYWQKLFYKLEDWQVPMVAQRRIWLVGYVEYTDAFGIRHRAGFCRRTNDEDAPKNNLMVDETCEPYNYDYEIDENGNRKPPEAKTIAPPKKWWQKRLRWS